MEGEGDEIKSKQDSKRTLRNVKDYHLSNSNNQNQTLEKLEN